MILESVKLATTILWSLAIPITLLVVVIRSTSAPERIPVRHD